MLKGPDEIRCCRISHLLRNLAQCGLGVLEHLHSQLFPDLVDQLRIDAAFLSQSALKRADADAGKGRRAID